MCNHIVEMEYILNGYCIRVFCIELLKYVLSHLVKSINKPVDQVFFYKDIVNIYKDHVNINQVRNVQSDIQSTQKYSAG